jgi:hypothetical protein
MGSIGQAVLLIAIGVAFAGIGGYLYTDQQAAIENSVPIEGTVVASGVDVDRPSDPDDAVSYYPEITYRYEYEGQSYTNDNVFPGSGRQSTSESRASSIAAEYAEGETVTVYVDPSEPQRSFLVRESSELFHFVFVGIGVFAALAGVVSLGRRVI